MAGHSSIMSAAAPRALSPPPVVGRTCDFVVSPKEAAEILDIHDRTLRRLDQKGEGPEKIKLSVRRYGYRISAIERWLAERVCKPKDATPERRPVGAKRTAGVSSK
jgi:predicted DNA-binding transcriptional regulator AlpA